MEKTLIRNLACYKDKIAPQFGCEKDIIRKEKDIRNIRNTKNQNINIRNQEKDIM